MPTPRNSTNLKLLLGTRADRIAPTAPIPARHALTSLPWFTARQQEIWDEVTAELGDMDLLAAADRYEIAAYVTVASHLEQLARELNAHPDYAVATRNGAQVAPLLLAFDRLVMRLSALGTKLGLSPAGRTSIHGRRPAGRDNDAELAGPFAS